MGIKLKSIGPCQGYYWFFFLLSLYKCHRAPVHFRWLYNYILLILSFIKVLQKQKVVWAELYLWHEPIISENGAKQSLNHKGLSSSSSFFDGECLNDMGSNLNEIFSASAAMLRGCECIICWGQSWGLPHSKKHLFPYLRASLQQHCCWNLG